MSQSGFFQMTKLFFSLGCSGGNKLLLKIYRKVVYELRQGRVCQLREVDLFGFLIMALGQEILFSKLVTFLLQIITDMKSFLKY